ncbi:MAG: hypothetical protein ACE5FS_03440 [Paracoccaceae bacterium]
MKLALKKASTSVTVNVFIQDSSSTTGAGLTGLVFNSASLTAYYARPRAAAAAITLATQTVTGAWSSGGFVEIDSTNMPGWYRLDIPDAALATGVDHVAIHLKGATNMAPLPLEIQLTDVDLNDGVRGGMTALPNAAADAPLGLPISDAGGLDLDAKLANTNEITVARMGALTDWIDGGRLDLILDIIAADVVNLDGAAMRGTDNALLAASAPTNFGDLSITATTGLVSLAAAQTFDMTGDVSGSVGSVTGAVGSVTGNVGGNVTGSVGSISGVTFPTNFGDLAITVTAGEVTVGTNTDKAGYSISGTKTTLDALNDLSAAEVNAEVVDAVTVDTIAELPQGKPTATPTIATALMLPYMALRNKIDITSSAKEVHNDAGTVICKKALTDDGSVYSEAEMVSGP